MPPVSGTKPAAATRGVDPDHPVGPAGQRSHLRAQERGVVAFPAVGDDHDDSPVGHAAPAVPVHEQLQRVADPGATAPVGHRRDGAAQREVGAAEPQGRGQAGQAGAEDEHLGVGLGGSTPEQVQVGPGEGLHRGRDVQQRHQAPGLAPAGPADDPRRVAARARAPPQGPSHVHGVTRGRPAATPAQPRGQCGEQAVEQRCQGSQLVLVQLAEARLREPLLAAGDRPQRTGRGGVVVPGRSRHLRQPGGRGPGRRCGARPGGGPGLGGHGGGLPAVVGDVHQPPEDEGEEGVERRQGVDRPEQADPRAPVELVDRRRPAQLENPCQAVGLG